jgi:hypothetical protein
MDIELKLSDIFVVIDKQGKMYPRLFLNKEEAEDITTKYYVGATIHRGFIDEKKKS